MNFGELSKCGIPLALAKEILASGVERIELRDNLTCEGLYFKLFRTIFLRRLFPEQLKVAAEILSRQNGIDVSSEETYLFTLLHEWAHHKGLKDPEADVFARKELCRRRGYDRRFTIRLNIGEVPCR